MSSTITALSAGTTYVARVTAIDAEGNESACSGSASGVAEPDFSVTPSTTTSFGSVAVGSTADRTFTVQNTSTMTLSGAASVAAPYSILSGSPFSLDAGSSQTVTVRFQPTASGTFAGNVNFTVDADTISRAVSGSGTGTGGTTVTLSVAKSGSGAGTVTSAPAGINCGATCSRSFALGTALTLTATPAAGSVFAGWTGACSGTGSCAVTVNATTTATATFNLAGPSSPPGEPDLPRVTLLSADPGGVTFALAWTPGTGATSYAYTAAFSDGIAAQQGTVTAPSLQLRMPYHASGAAAVGFICVQSLNAAGQSSSQSCASFQVPARGTAPAPVTLSVTKNGSGSGTVTTAPAGINCGAICSQSIVPGTALTFTATPAAGSVFAGWTGACSGTGSCSITVNLAATATATFNLVAPPSPPGEPDLPRVTLLSADFGGVTFALAWTPATGATSYAYTAAFSDGTAAQQGTVTAPSGQLRMPYHASGAAAVGFICVRSLNAAGQTSSPSCNAFQVPARGTAPAPVTLSVTKNGSGSGTVTTAPAGINCGAICSQSIVPGTALTLTATPAAGSVFAGWTGACSGTGSCSITVNLAATATATFNLVAPPSPPGEPDLPRVTLLSADSGGVTFALAWTPGTGATSYAYAAAFSDGAAAQQGTVTTPSLQLRMPYHASGAAAVGFVCVQSLNAAGQTSSPACNAFQVPAGLGG